MELLRRRREATVAVLLRGAVPAPPQAFGRLAEEGIAITPLEAAGERGWVLGLQHPKWGLAKLRWQPGIPLPPPDLVEMGIGLLDDEKGPIRDAGHALALTAVSSRAGVLRDRKNLLRFARAVGGDDAVGVLDVASQVIWSPASLSEELSHDADLDIEATYCLHAVHDGEPGRRGTVTWLHSHGLAELGAFDFDVLRPGRGVGAEILRALAFGIVEGSLQPDEEWHPLVSPGGAVRLVPVADFMRHAPAEERSLRDADEAHSVARSVVCEPAGRLGRLLGRQVRASRFLSRPVPDDVTLPFSSEASELMALRARRTAGVLRSLLAEFDDLSLPAVVKLGYPTDPGARSEREHLWFEVHGMGDTDVEATLLNSPWSVGHLKQGARGRHPLAFLSDWRLMTPAGDVTPRDLRPARAIRANREEIERLVRRSRGSGG